MIFSISNYQIIWGGNYFVEYLKPSMGWLYWDKGQNGLSMSDGELAFTSIQKALRAFVCNRSALVGAEHPTQKPVKLMEWCIDYLPNDVKTIIDPFMGSGTTGVACMNLEKQFVGIERERKYFDIACKRLEDAQRQERLF